ncbi:MAG: hypothetical protein AAFU49_13980 [Pseudomonadota bacterium]
MPVLLIARGAARRRAASAFAATALVVAAGTAFCALETRAEPQDEKVSGAYMRTTGDLAHSFADGSILWTALRSWF